ncbi:MAG TPA: hypothetical protein VG605_05710 [Puia sp.]|jgi:hypothetical protein|nr:hypothetical protein [Puia sp.]
MKRILLFFALSFLLYACQRKLKQQDTKEQLEKAMARYLAGHQATKDSKLHFDVLDVSYFQDSTFYDCNFTVKMTLPDGRDTTGFMKERVSKDFMQFNKTSW